MKNTENQKRFSQILSDAFREKNTHCIAVSSPGIGNFWPDFVCGDDFPHFVEARIGRDILEAGRSDLIFSFKYLLRVT